MNFNSLGVQNLSRSTGSTLWPDSGIPYTPKKKADPKPAPADPNCMPPHPLDNRLDEYFETTKVVIYKSEIYLYYNTNIKYLAAAQGACKNYDRNCSDLAANEKQNFTGQSWVQCKTKCDQNSGCTGFSHRPDTNACQIVFKQGVDPDTCDTSSKEMCNVRDPDHEGPHLRKVDNNSRHLLFNLDLISDPRNVYKITCGEFSTLKLGQPLYGARLEQSPGVKNHLGGAIYITHFSDNLKDQVMDRNAFESYMFDETKI